MKGLILKDLINLRKYFKTISIFVIFYAFLTFSMDDASFLSGMIILLFMMIPISSFSYDQLSHWDLYAVSLPISRKEIVGSKYILAGLLLGFGAIISIVLNVILLLTKGAVIDWGYLLTVTYSVFVVGLVFISILIPLIYKFGVERSRMMMLIIFTIPMLFVMLLSNFDIELPSGEKFFSALTFSPILLLIVLAVSFRMSLKIFQAKDL